MAMIVQSRDCLAKRRGWNFFEGDWTLRLTTTLVVIWLGSIWSSDPLGTYLNSFTAVAMSDVELIQHLFMLLFTKSRHIHVLQAVRTESLSKMSSHNQTPAPPPPSLSEWHKLPISLDELSIDTTLRCGQAFRWRKINDTWFAPLETPFITCN